MSRSNWFVVLTIPALVLGAVATSPADARSFTDERPLPLSPDASLLVASCPSVEARERFEEADCFQAIRYALMEGRIDIAEAVSRLETCALMRRAESGAVAAGRGGQAADSLAAATATTEYRLRLAMELRTLEAARLRYLASAAYANQDRSSIRSFISKVRRLGRSDPASIQQAETAARDRAAMVAQLDRLERSAGIHPLIVQSAAESVGLAAGVAESCQTAAERRGGWIRRGSGVVAGLVGAAAVVVATGATGTLMGGIVIAAALEASVGAYFLARSEHLEPPVVTTGRLSSVLPAEAEERSFRRSPADVRAEAGEEGTGGGEYEEFFEDEGQREELAGLTGEGVEEEGDSEDSTGEERRQNTIPAILPLELPEELRELPPLLERASMPELAGLSLPEIQERLDDFLALRDPSVWAMVAETATPVSPVSLQQMMAEAQSALDLWEGERRLHEGFGPFFVSAELEQVAVERRAEVLPRALGRYMHDRDLYHDAGTLDELRQRVAERMVTHCRAGESAGDLVLSACTSQTALTLLLVASIRDTGVRIPASYTLGVQAFGNHFEAVLYSRVANEVYSLTKGTRTEGIVAPIFHPASFYYAYLVSHNVVPEIDFDRHLMLALPDREMPESLIEEACEAKGDGNVVERAVGWLGSLVGVRRVADECGRTTPRSRGQQGGNRGIDIAMPMPRNPLQGGGQSGGGGGGGGGGGSSMPASGPRDASGGSSGGGQAGGGAGGQSADGSAAGQDASGSDAGGNGDSGSGGGAGGRAGDAEQGQTGGADGQPDTGQTAGASGSAGSGGTGGFSVGNVVLPPGPDLAAIGRETSALAKEYERNRNDRIVPWRLREDEGMITGSTTRVLFADNARALERFEEDDLFITLTPAEVEAQRRMLEADDFPIFAAETTCESPGLPPRRVFRRTATNERGFRYVYCDQNESMVIFRNQEDAQSYAELSPPDRPLYLARLAAERLERFERSREIRRVQAFLADPNTLRELSKDEIYAMVKAAGEVLVFQNALESALVQSMNELGPSGIRSYYYDMHRQVLQAPFFVRMAQDVHRLNRRLASDPLQSLAWANAQPTLARRGFFDLYYNLGGMMEWPERWAILESRYGNGNGPPAAEDGARSLDFLQILSDPTRVRIDWTAERQSRPSILDREMQEGLERTQDPVDEPTLAELIEREEEEKHLRGGTGGLGRAGRGTSLGPEEGKRPLQMLRIRITPESGDPDREQLPDDNQIRPGGTEGENRTQTEESASRQEAYLWVSPQTFAEAVLSTWDESGLGPESADRVPPIVRFNERLRQVFLRDLRPEGVYDNRLLAAMEIFTSQDWLDYSEVRAAMGGDWVNAAARDTRRFSAAYSGNPPINDEDQITIPNFFTAEGVTLPADLYGPVQEHFSRTILGIFELADGGAVRAGRALASAPVGPTQEEADARARLLRSLEVIGEQALPAE